MLRRCYLKDDVRFAGVILELKDDIQYVRKSKFIKVISLKKHNKFCVKRHFFLENGELQQAVSNTENVLGWQ